MVEEGKEIIPIIHSIIYSEYSDVGQEAKAWISVENLSMRELTQIGIKTFSLMAPENINIEDGIKDAKQIIEEKDEFGIIPYVDQNAIGISYLFRYKNSKEEDIHCTLTILFLQEFKHFLFSNHESIKKILKYASFKILKLNLGSIKPLESDLQRQIHLLMDKLLRYNKEGILP